MKMNIQRLVLSGTNSLLADFFLMVTFPESGATLLLLESAFLEIIFTSAFVFVAYSFPTLFWFSKQITYLKWVYKAIMIISLNHHTISYLKFCFNCHYWCSCYTCIFLVTNLIIALGKSSVSFSSTFHMRKYRYRHAIQANYPHIYLLFIHIFWKLNQWIKDPKFLYTFTISLVINQCHQTTQLMSRNKMILFKS